MGELIEEEGEFKNMCHVSLEDTFFFCEKDRYKKT